MSQDETIGKILIADDEKNMRRVLSAMLAREGFDTIEAENGNQALARVEKEEPICVITDLKMPEMDGLELLEKIQERNAALPVIMITAHGTVDTAVRAMKEGAFDYLTKPFDKAELLNIVKKAVATAAIRRQEPTENTYGKNFVIGSDPAMDDVLNLIDRVAKTDITVLITGETGTGKELIARLIHRKSSRRDKPFIAINCAAIPEELTESELFGYEKGAFTGAVSSKPGRFELADQGTLFLDEVGATSGKVQTKLLRVLQERSFERVGGVKTLSSDTRLIAATNQDLQKEVEGGGFRQDLYYRINVVEIPLPPLRQRTGDILPLARFFVEKFAKRQGKPLEGIGESAVTQLLLYDWPGNIRELENAMERAVLMADSGRVELADLPPQLRQTSRSQAPSVVDGTLRERVQEATARLERQLILDALEETGNNVTQAAKVLGLSRKGLQLKMKALELRSSDDS